MKKAISLALVAIVVSFVLAIPASAQDDFQRARRNLLRTATDPLLEAYDLATRGRYGSYDTFPDQYRAGLARRFGFGGGIVIHRDNREKPGDCVKKAAKALKDASPKGTAIDQQAILAYCTGNTPVATQVQRELSYTPVPPSPQAMTPEVSWPKEVFIKDGSVLCNNTDYPVRVFVRGVEIGPPGSYLGAHRQVTLASLRATPDEITTKPLNQ